MRLPAAGNSRRASRPLRPYLRAIDENDERPQRLVRHCGSSARVAIRILRYSAGTRDACSLRPPTLPTLHAQTYQKPRAMSTDLPTSGGEHESETHAADAPRSAPSDAPPPRSEERRVGKE